MSFRECFGVIVTVIQTEGSCRVIYAFNQLLWIFGSLYIAIGSISVYSKATSTQFIIISGLLGILGILCTIFTISNALHICLQLPTSHASLKLQRVGHIFMLLVYAGGLSIYSVVSQLEEHVPERITVLVQCSIIYVLLLLTSISCFYI